LEIEIEHLEKKQIELQQIIETQASLLQHEDFTNITNELTEIEEQLNTKTIRWLELEEKNN
jgi:hypothetical protein